MEELPEKEELFFPRWGKTQTSLRGKGTNLRQNSEGTPAALWPSWCRVTRAQINPLQPWSAASWGTHLCHREHLCCDQDWVTSKDLLTSSSPFILVENKVLEAYEE